jgi:hypothetical protein
VNVGLIDVDSTSFPNLVLMKLSAWYKQQGHDTFLLSPDDVLHGENLFTPYDKLLGACVFTKNAGTARTLQSMGADIGGIGVDNKRVLPDEIEHIYPDYSLYGITDTAYGFLSRGCPRGCPFCVVAGKEGKRSYKVADLSEWWSGQKNIKLCDPNLLACPEHMELLEQLADSKAYVDVNQGFDARLLSPEIIKAMNRVRISVVHFAWDNPKDKVVQDKLLMFRELTTMPDTGGRNKRVYCLTNYWSTFKQDLERVYWLRDNGYDPYVMIYEKETAPKRLRQLQRWVNNKFIFRSCERFEDYGQHEGSSNGRS